jgi:hypothetical protein
MYVQVRFPLLGVGQALEGVAVGRGHVLAAHPIILEIRVVSSGTLAYTTPSDANIPEGDVGPAAVLDGLDRRQLVHVGVGDLGHCLYI